MRRHARDRGADVEPPADAGESVAAIRCVAERDDRRDAVKGRHLDANLLGELTGGVDARVGRTGGK